MEGMEIRNEPETREGGGLFLFCRRIDYWELMSFLTGPEEFQRLRERLNVPRKEERSGVSPQVSIYRLCVEGRQSQSPEPDPKSLS